MAPDAPGGAEVPSATRLEPNVHPATSARAPACPIVAIGAPAAGLPAVLELLGHVPRDSGMAFVVLVRPGAERSRHVAEVLAGATRLPVEPVRHNVLIEPDRVYVIPSRLGVGVRDGEFTLSSDPIDRRALRLPIDRFFEALAQERGGRALGVLLSGTGADGCAGLGAIRAENGVTFAQDPRTARLGSRDVSPGASPDAAIEAGVVDRVLPIPALAMELLRLGRHPFVRQGRSDLGRCADAELDGVLARVRAVTGVDVGDVDRAGLRRRLARRMALLRVRDLAEYERLLLDDATEAEALFRDLLLHAPSFFGDRETREELERRVFPELLRRRRDGGAIRIWSAGCAGGEEPYALVTSLLEFLDRAGAADVMVQLFGSDVSDRAIAKARAGVYSDDELRGLGEAPRARYFRPLEGSGHRVRTSLRRRCTFVKHDVARDPPFSKLDLVLCRNVLGFFGAAQRRRALANLHFALRDPGFLVVGRGERVADGAALFDGHPDVGAGARATCLARRRTARASFLRAFVRPAAAALERARACEAEPGEERASGARASREDAILEAGPGCAGVGVGAGAEAVADVTGAARAAYGEAPRAAAIVGLQRELEATKERLAAMTWEHRRAQDGLRALNEELLSRNEELLALNHDLGRAKDAQEATNEELRTLTEELWARNEVVEDVNRRKDLFLATLSHELRTPLTSLLLQTQLLRRGRQDAERVRRAADGIERAAHAQARLIDDLLDVSRIVTGKLRLDVQSVRLASIVQGAIETVEPTAERRQITLDRALDEALPPVAGDPARLQQAVLNLLTNSIKFSPDGARVRVELDEAGGQGRIRVTDGGIGIAADFLPDIFERFSQEERGVTRTRGGLGLGLAIVRYVVEAHGGAVVAESPGVGQGATFTLRLPLTSSPSAFAPLDGATAGQGATAGTLDDVRVLIVDDDLGTRDALAEMLGSCGAQVRSVDSAARAMRAFDELEPDVVVSDVAMPGEDGYHLLACIRARGAERGGDVPALALTGLATRDDSRRALAAGFQLHLAKPVDTERLVAALAELARRCPRNGCDGPRAGRARG